MDLPTQFEERAREILSAYPYLRHTWKTERGNRVLVFPPVADEGFEVWVEVSADVLIVGAGEAHHHFEYDKLHRTAAIDAALGLVRDLLSPAMRLREVVVGAVPIRTLIEAAFRDGWKVEEETGRLLFNYLGRRTERIRQNRSLPPREPR